MFEARRSIFSGINVSFTAKNFKNLSFHCVLCYTPNFSGVWRQDASSKQSSAPTGNIHYWTWYTPFPNLASASWKAHDFGDSSFHLAPLMQQGAEGGPGSHHIAREDAYRLDGLDPDCNVSFFARWQDVAFIIYNLEEEADWEIEPHSRRGTK